VDAPTSVAQLIEKFHQERDYLRAASTKEHLVREAYIDPLFSALGWDLDYSKQGPLEESKETS
jgi:predicted type IV restriction endonuclease